MGIEKVLPMLAVEVAEIDRRGTAKRHESVITEIRPGHAGLGPRCMLAGHGAREFLRMNSNSYLGLNLHPKVKAAGEEAVKRFGSGPGAVRFISGTYQPHRELEGALAAFHGRPGAMLFSAAYATVMGVLPLLVTPETGVVSDALNHNCIINAMRLGRPAVKEVYPHLDMQALEKAIAGLRGKVRRLLVVTDGIFSMRGDHAPLDRINHICAGHEAEFAEGIITVVDDSHGIAAFGQSGRGTEEYTGGRADLLIATLGKGLGVNGGYVAAEAGVIDYLREKAPFYVYSNPITPAEAAASLAALAVLDSSEGADLLARLRHLGKRLRGQLREAGHEILAGDHPIVPLMVRDSRRCAQLVRRLFEHDILATGLSYPVVPRGDEEIRLQVSASHTERDIDQVVAALAG